MAQAENGAALLEVARSLRSRILAERDRIETARRLPEDLTRELARAGFFRIYLPAAYGGLDLTPMEAMEIFEELARADASAAWCVWNGNTHWTAAQLSPEAARIVYADPDVVTANSTRPSGQAQVVDGGYRVNGRWSLVSGCELGTWMVLLCVVHDGDRPRFAGSGAPEARFMLIPSSKCEIVDTWTVGGLRGTGSHDVVAHDVFVPNSFGSGFTDPYVLPEPRYRIPPFSRVVPGLGAMALGIARTAIPDAHRTCGREDAAADDTEVTREPRRPNSDFRGRVAGALGAPVFVRQPGTALDHRDRDGRSPDASASTCSTSGIACRLQRRPSGRSDVHCRRCKLDLCELPLGTRLSRRARDHPASWGSAAGDGINGPSFARARAGHASPLIAVSQVFSVVR